MKLATAIVTLARVSPLRHPWWPVLLLPWHPCVPAVTTVGTGTYPLTGHTGTRLTFRAFATAPTWSCTTPTSTATTPTSVGLASTTATPVRFILSCAPWQTTEEAIELTDSRYCTPPRSWLEQHVHCWCRHRVLGSGPSMHRYARLQVKLRQSTMLYRRLQRAWRGCSIVVAGEPVQPNHRRREGNVLGSVPHSQ